jgi:GNAT superfamily N-acetyltransferase
MVDRLTEIEAYYDAVPRAAARAEEIGPFTLFVNHGSGWSYYARPSLGAVHFTEADVQRVRARQRSLGVPEAFEWVDQTTPSLAVAAAGAGLAVDHYPLMLLGERHPVHTDAVQVRLATAADDLALLDAIAHVAFHNAGTQIGAADLETARGSVRLDASTLAFQHERLSSGRTITAIAFVDDEPVGVGSYQPIGSVTEVVGVGVLPAFRRRGVGAALTSHLVTAALQRGQRTIFLSAGDATIGRVYERVGFQRIATACSAEPASHV